MQFWGDHQQMAQQVSIEHVRMAWQEQGLGAADALFNVRETQDNTPTRWWLLGCELAVARADLPVLQARWSRGWSQAAQQPALRQALVEALLDMPWDHELAPLWQQVAAQIPGKPIWRKQHTQRALQAQRPTAARALMDHVGNADNAGSWWPLMQAVWAGEGDEPWLATWLRHLDGRWLLANEGHSNFIPDVGAFSRLDHWVSGGHAAVIEAWRALVPPGAWADWLDMGAQVARWRAGDGLWSPCLSWPASVLTAWPKPVQRQALARLALLAEEPHLVRKAWLPQLEVTLAHHWPPEAARRTAAQIELNWLHETQADGARILDWLETKAAVQDLRPWWAPRALRECQHQPGALKRWQDWCDRFGTPELGLGVAGQDALAALCLLGREPQAQAMLAQWRQALKSPASPDDQGWLAVSEITVAMHHQQHAQAWQTLNHWWQQQGMAQLPAGGAAFSAAEMLDVMADVPWPAPAATAAVEPVTAVLMWPALNDADDDHEDADAAAQQTLRSLQMQDASGLTVLIVTDRELLNVATAPGANGTQVRVLRVSPAQELPVRIDVAIASVETPWLIWATPGSVWHPQALRARQQHLARHPQAEASQALTLALNRFGDVTVQHMRSGLPAGQDGFMVRTQRLRDLPALSPAFPDGWPLMRERIERQLGALRRPVWPCAMGLQTVYTLRSKRSHGLKARHRRALQRLVPQPELAEELVLG